MPQNSLYDDTHINDLFLDFNNNLNKETDTDTNVIPKQRRKSYDKTIDEKILYYVR